MDDLSGLDPNSSMRRKRYPTSIRDITVLISLLFFRLVRRYISKPKVIYAQNTNERWLLLDAAILLSTSALSSTKLVKSTQDGLRNMASRGLKKQSQRSG